MTEMGEAMNGGSENRARLEQRAEAMRSSLERRLDALDERRNRVLELAKKAAHPPVSIALLGAAAVVGAVVIARQIQKRPNRSQRIAASLFGPPPRKPQGFLMKAIKRSALAFVATLVQRASTRGLDRLLAEVPAPRLPQVPRPRGY